LSSVWVTVDLVAAYLLAAVAVTAGLRAVSLGWRPRPRALAVAAVAVVGALVLVAPFGSADHLSYAAYGRIVAQGGDPYLVPADRWRNGLDPVAKAVELPWRHTASVYGPVATALQAATSLVGGTSVRATVWASQLLVGGCFLLTGWLLDRMVRGDPSRRARAAVVWTLNPLLLGTVVGGDHIDGVCVAAATVCLFLGLRTLTDRVRPVGPGPREAAVAAATGASWAVAAATKPPYAAVGLALLWGMRGSRWRVLARPVGVAALGAAVVLVPAYVWAGSHVLDQYGRASRYVSLASPWAVPMSAVERLLGLGVRVFIPLALAPVGLVALAAVWQIVRLRLPLVGTGAGWVPAGAEDTVSALLALSAAYLIAAPYVLPWYDAVAWPALAAAGTTALDGALTMRLTALAIAYVPGRVESVSADVAAVTLDVRSFVAPVITTGVLLWVLVSGARCWRGRDPGPGAEPSAAVPQPRALEAFSISVMQASTRMRHT